MEAYSTTMAGERRPSRTWQRQKALSSARKFNLLLLCTCLTLLVYQCTAQTTTATYAPEAITIGVNYGTVADNLPTPAIAVAQILSMKIGRVKIYSPDPTILTALENSGLDVVVAIPNDAILGLSASEAAADAWIEQYIAAYYPATNFVTILVGNELFSDSTLQSTWAVLVQTMQYLQTSLTNRGWSDSIKLSTAVALDVLATSYPPSAGTFRTDIAVPVIQPLLAFLSSTNSYFYVDVYPFLAYSSSPSDISLNYAIFGSSTSTDVVDGSLTYTNLMDAQLDAVNAATTKLGYGDVRLAVGETGWPTLGDADETGATIANAADYNRRLVTKILGQPTVGTPLRPGIFIPTFIFALFNEDLKPGATSERNWGLLYPNMTAVYAIDLTGKTTDTQYDNTTSTTDPPVLADPPVSTPPTSAPAPVSSTVSGTWCITNTAADNATVVNALNFACGAVSSGCLAIQPNGSCYDPNTVNSHASWAFNSYYNQYSSVGASSCDFAGAGVLTTTDPSYGACVYPPS